MAQHVVQALRIMREYRARPCLGSGNTLIPAYPRRLPLVDVFIIKLFAAPCKFTDPTANCKTREPMQSVVSTRPLSDLETSAEVRTIAPATRTELVKIAMSILRVLDSTSQLISTDCALGLISERLSLLEALESWHTYLAQDRVSTGMSGSDTICISFLRFFHQTLKLVVLGTLSSGSEMEIKLRAESDRLLDVARAVEEQVKDYQSQLHRR